MKNVIRTLAVVAAIAALAPVAQADTATDTVTVKVNLTSKCRWQGGTAPTGVEVDFGTYIAFQGTDNTGSPSTGLTLECTRGFGGTPTATWDGDSAGGGVIAGLNYTLSATAGTRVTGTAATVSTIGSADTVPFTLGGTMPADQAGAGAGGAQTATRTLTLTF
jgi:hypothetical protein